MINSVAFNPKWLKAAAMIAARRDIRYYLNGVLVEVFEHEARLVATDGHKMIFLRKLVDGCAPFRFIVPTSVLDLLRPVRKHYKIDATFEYDPANACGKMMLKYLDIGFQFSPIDGKFPDYAQTLNKAAKPSGERSTINISFLHDFKRATDCAFGVDRLYTPQIWHNGDGPAAITFRGRDDFFGIVMPMRDHSPFTAPDWTIQKTADMPHEEALA